MRYNFAHDGSGKYNFVYAEKVCSPVVFFCSLIFYADMQLIICWRPLPPSLFLLANNARIAHSGIHFITLISTDDSMYDNCAYDSWLLRLRYID
jgi:hypothetical protein